MAPKPNRQCKQRGIGGKAACFWQTSTATPINQSPLRNKQVRQNNRWFSIWDT